MTNEHIERAYKKVRGKIGRRNANELKATLERESDDKFTLIDNLEFSQKLSPTIMFVIAFISTCFGFILFTLNFVLLNIVVPRKTDVSKYAYSVSATLNELYDKSYAYGYAYDKAAGENTEKYFALFYDETGTKTYDEFVLAGTDRDEAHEKYLAKLTEYKTACAFVNDKFNNYDRFELEKEQLKEPDTSDNDYEVKKATYDAKLKELNDGLALYLATETKLPELETEVNALANDYYNKLAICVQLRNELNCEYIDWEESISQSGKEYIYGNMATYGGLADEMNAKLNMLNASVASYNEAFALCEQLSLSIAEKKINLTRLVADRDYANVVYGLIMNDMHNYLTVTSVSVYADAVEAEEHLRTLDEARKELELTEETRIATEEAYNQYLNGNEYYFAKSRYEINETILRHFALDGYAELNAKEQKDENDTKKLNDMLTLVETYGQAKVLTLSDYIAAYTVDPQDKATVQAYIDWHNAVKAVTDYLNTYVYAATECDELIKNKYLELEQAKGQIASAYYDIENLSVWFKGHINLIAGISADVAGSLPKYDKNYDEVLRSADYAEMCATISSYVSSARTYDMGEDDFAAFDISEYDFETKVTVEGSDKEITLAKRKYDEIIEIIDGLNYAEDTNKFTADFYKIRLTSDKLDAAGYANYDGTLNLYMPLLPFNAILMALNFIYFVATIMLYESENKKKNYETLLKALNI